MQNLLSPPSYLAIPRDPVIKEIPDIYDNIVIIGDVHGVLDSLLELLKTIPSGGFNAYVFLGDLVDRGPQSGDVVRYVAETKHAYTTLGNHDECHVRYEGHRLIGSTKMKRNEEFLRAHSQLRPSEILYLASCPQGYTWRNHLMIHAGIMPNWGVRQPTKAFIRNRYLIPKNGVWQMSQMWQDSTNTWVHDPEAVEWFRLFEGDIPGLKPYQNKPWNIVYGHANQKDITIVNNTYGLDTGCVFGGFLTAMVINCKTEDIKFYQAKGLQHEQT
jgi:serine/threonine protein phosphatase 1